MVQMDMGRSNDVNQIPMLDIHNLLTQVPLMMIVDDGQHTGDVLAVVLPDLLDQALADQIPNELRARGIAFANDTAVELIEERSRKGDAEADRFAGILHGNDSRTGVRVNFVC